MHKIEIPQIKFSQEIPSELSECTPEQFAFFAKTFLRLQNTEIDYPMFRMLLLFNFLQVKPSGWFLTAYEHEVILSECYRLSEILDSFGQVVVTEGKPEFTLNLGFTRNLMPVISYRSRKYYGPSDALLNICFQEYIDAYHHYIEYLESQDEMALNRMIAVLYRPKRKFLWVSKRLSNYNGQIRERYNDQVIESRAVTFGKLPMHIRFAVFLFFRGCEEFLRNGEIPLGGSMIKFSLLYENATKGQDDDTGLVGLLYTLAESQVFGNARQTAETNLYDVMVRIYQLMRSFKNREARHDTAE